MHLLNSAFRRQLTLLITALLALQLSFGLAQSSDSNPVLIQAGSKTERLNDLEWRFNIALRGYLSNMGMPYSDELAGQLRSLFPQYLEQRANELVLLNEAERRGITADRVRVGAYLDEVRASVPEGGDYRSLLANAGFSSQAQLATMIMEADRMEQLFDALEADAQPTENQIRVRYLADRQMYASEESYCAKHILVGDEAFAQELVDRVGAGEAFEDLAAAHGTDATATRGGDLGCFGLGRMVADFENAVVSAPVGETIGPVQSQFGYHLILVYEHQPAAVPSLDAVREYVVDSLVNDNINSVIEGLIRGGGAVTYPERLDNAE